MQPHLFRCLAISIVCVLSSCLPRERMWWSPDGGTAILSTREGLVTAGADGVRTGDFRPGTALSMVLDGPLAWSPDGAMVHLVVEKRGMTWAEARALVPSSESARVDALVRMLPPMIRAARESLAPGKGAVKDTLAGLPMGDDPMLPIALGVAYEQDPAGVRALFQGLEEEADIVSALAAGELKPVVYQIESTPAPGGNSGPVMPPRVTSLLPLGQLKPSPDGAWLAFVRQAGNSRTIEILSTREQPAVVSPPSLGETKEQLEYQWSADSARLFVLGVSSEGAAMGRLEAWNPWPENESDPARRVLCEGIFTNPPALARLPDGSLLLAACPVAYPAPAEAAPPQPAFFRVAPDGASIREIPMTGGTPPGDLRFIQVSPDGSRVALVEAANTRVSLFDIQSGVVRRIAEGGDGWKCLTRPAWRDADELVFAVESGGQPVLMSHSPETGTRPWGEGFASGAFDGWVAAPDAEN